MKNKYSLEKSSSDLSDLIPGSLYLVIQDSLDRALPYRGEWLTCCYRGDVIMFLGCQHFPDNEYAVASFLTPAGTIQKVGLNSSFAHNPLAWITPAVKSQ
jgi:hypothetical protein